MTILIPRKIQTLYDLHSNPDQLHGYSTKEYRVPELAYELARARPELRPKLESTIAKDAEHAYWYAVFVKGKFPEGEPAIAKNPKFARLYAAAIGKGRWRPGEAAIATDARESYEYAKIIQGRFPAGEAAIAKSPRFSAYYKEFLESLE